MYLTIWARETVDNVLRRQLVQNVIIRLQVRGNDGSYNTSLYGGQRLDLTVQLVDEGVDLFVALVLALDVLMDGESSFIVVSVELEMEEGGNTYLELFLSGRHQQLLQDGVVRVDLQA